MRGHELFLRNSLLHASMDDDWIYEPWITVQAVKQRPAEGLWGQHADKKQLGQAFITQPVAYTIEDIQKLTVTPHRIDEGKTAELRDFYGEVFDGILDVCVSRRPIYFGLGGSDLSTSLSELLGLQNMMVAMLEEPELVHALAAFLQKAVLDQFESADVNGDWTPHGGWWETEGTPYCRELPDPNPRIGKNSAQNLWCFCAAQEFTLISPAMHEEFMLNYQLPILKRFGLVSYGCCENLTSKIHMLRSIPNLRRIGIAPTADVAKCAEQIGRDYVFAWRPNPAMVCAYFDRGTIREQLRNGLRAAEGCCVDIMLKDISTVQGEPERLNEWILLAKDAAAKYI